MDVVPTTFGRTVPVPGLTSLAAPPFVDPPGPKVADRGTVPQKDPRRDAFWYRRTFRLGATERANVSDAIRDVLMRDAESIAGGFA